MRCRTKCHKQREFFRNHYTLILLDQNEWKDFLGKSLICFKQSLCEDNAKFSGPNFLLEWNHWCHCSETLTIVERFIYFVTVSKGVLFVYLRVILNVVNVLLVTKKLIVFSDYKLYSECKRTMAYLGHLLLFEKERSKLLIVLHFLCFAFLILIWYDDTWLSSKDTSLEAHAWRLTIFLGSDHYPYGGTLSNKKTSTIM